MAWLIDQQDDVTIVEMRSNDLNLQDEGFFADLNATFDHLEGRPNPHQPVVLVGSPRAFSAGLRLDYTFELFASGDLDAVTAWFHRYRATNVRLFSFEAPLIGAINGHAIAGGLVTALSCDLRIGCPHAQFSLNEVQIGIPMPQVYIEIVRDALGSRAAETMLLGHRYGAAAARALNILHEVRPADEVREHATRSAAAIDPDTLKAFVATKTALRRPALRAIAEAEHIDECIPAILCSDESVRAQSRAYAELKARTERS